MSYRKGRYDIYNKSVGGAGAETLLLETGENKNVTDWSSDGRFLLFTNVSETTARDIWALPLEGGKAPFILVQTLGAENDAKFAPDGRWISYTSNETGRNEIYVQPFPGPARSVQVSTGGGFESAWSRDGRTLFYLAPGGGLMSVAMRLQAPETIEPGRPVELFRLKPTSEFVVAGQDRFLVNVPVGDVPTPPLTVILNWAARK